VNVAQISVWREARAPEHVLLMATVWKGRYFCSNLSKYCFTCELVTERVRGSVEEVVFGSALPVLFHVVGAQLCREIASIQCRDSLYLVCSRTRCPRQTGPDVRDTPPFQENASVRSISRLISVGL